MMKSIFLLALVAISISLSFAGVSRGPPSPVLINRSLPPKPGQRWEYPVGVHGTWRFKREAHPQGSVSATYKQPLSGPDRRPTYNFDYQHNIFEGKNGHVSAGGGAVKYPGQRWEPQVGIQGTWRF